MHIMLFDTETTGLTNRDEVIQFCGILIEITRTEGKPRVKLKKLYNFYCDTARAIHHDAQKVHGIDKDTLKKLSHGLTFEDQFYPIVRELEPLKVMWVAYNISFDIRLINQTLTNNGLPAYNFGKSVSLLREYKSVTNMCLMKTVTALCGYPKNKKLANVISEICSDKELQHIFKKFASYCNLDTEISFHNAIFDTVCLYIIMNKYYLRLVG